MYHFILLFINTYFLINFQFCKGANKSDGGEVSRAEMFIKTRQGRLNRKGKAVDEDTLEVIVSFLLLIMF